MVFADFLKVFPQRSLSLSYELLSSNELTENFAEMSRLWEGSLGLSQYVNYSWKLLRDEFEFRVALLEGVCFILMLYL
jgi:hypothetical protein